jgi:hypothetical protein
MRNRPRGFILPVLFCRANARVRHLPKAAMGRVPRGIPRCLLTYRNVSLFICVQAPGAGASEPSRATRRNSLGFTPAWSRKKRVKCGGALHLEADHGLLDAERSQYRRSLRASLAGKPMTTVAHSRLGDDACSLEKMTAFPDSALGGARSADRAKSDSPAGAADCRRADFTRILAPDWTRAGWPPNRVRRIRLFLRAHTSQARPCRFRSGYPVPLPCRG